MSPGMASSLGLASADLNAHLTLPYFRDITHPPKQITNIYGTIVLAKGGLMDYGARPYAFYRLVKLLILLLRSYSSSIGLWVPHHGFETRDNRPPYLCPRK